MITSLIPTVQAEDILPQNSVTTVNTIIVKEKNTDVSDRPAVYDLKDLIVEEDADPVRKALDVFKKRSKPKYKKRIWVTDKRNGERRMIVEYSSENVKDKIIFSQDENVMYYFGLTPGGTNFVYGIDLLSGDKHSFGRGDDFMTVDCPDRTSYFVVQTGKARTVYHVYTSSGKKTRTFTDLKSPLDIEKNLCR
jgi:hypothetical protein